MKLSYADRDKYYGDPRFVHVPIQQLLSDKYTEARQTLIDMNKASREIRPGDPYNLTAFGGPAEYWPGEPGTTTCVVADQWGNVVAATPSANPPYGICQSLGIAHNTRLSTLNTEKGHPNSIAPEKRPRITLTPTIVLKNKKPILAMSVAGGDLQDQASLQLFLQFAEFGRPPEDAIQAPRFNIHHIEDSFKSGPTPVARLSRIGVMDLNQTEETVIHNLQSRGHEVHVVDGPIAYPVMLIIDQETGVFHAASLPNRKYSAVLKPAR